jgi:hypothetical protein
MLISELIFLLVSFFWFKCGKHALLFSDWI